MLRYKNLQYTRFRGVYHQMGKPNRFGCRTMRSIPAFLRLARQGIYRRVVQPMFSSLEDDTMGHKIGFIGLGNMGKGVCHNLIKAGNELSVYDTSPEAMARFEGQAYLAGSGAEVFERSEICFLSLPNSEVVEAMFEAFFDAGMAGKLVVDLSTSNPISTRALYQRTKQAGGNLIDSPLSGGPQEAWDGTMNILVAGDKDVVDAHDWLFKSYSKFYLYVGAIGNGHLLKLAQNWAGLLQAVVLAQLYPLINWHGISEEELFDALNNEVFSNWVFQFYSKKYVNRDYPMDFALQLGYKDMTYMKALCDEAGVPGYVLDGAMALCEKSLEDAKKRDVVPDMSYVNATMYHLLDDEAR